MVIPVLERRVEWVCPNCSMTDVTNDPRPHSRMHSCSGLAGMIAPFVEAGLSCKVEAVEREDWIGQEHVQVNLDGRPIMAVETTRDDGTDRVVFAPTAIARIG